MKIEAYDIPRFYSKKDLSAKSQAFVQKSLAILETHLVESLAQYETYHQVEDEAINDWDSILAQVLNGNISP